MLQLSELLAANKIASRHGLPINEKILYVFDEISKVSDKVDTTRMIELMKDIQGITENVIPVNVHSDGMDDLPHIFDISQIFDMNIEEAVSQATENVDEDKFYTTVTAFLEANEEAYKDIIFATLPYDRCFFLLSDLETVNAFFRNYNVPNKYADDLWIEKDLSCLVSQQEMDKPLINPYISMKLMGQKDWSKDARSVTEILSQEDIYQEDGELHHIKKSLLGDAWDSEEIRPHFLLHIDFFVRDVTHGPTYLNTAIISLNNIGKPLGQYLLVDPDSHDSLYDQFDKYSELVRNDEETSRAIFEGFEKMFGKGAGGENQYVFNMATQMIFRETLLIKMSGWAILKTLMWMNSKNDIMVNEDTAGSRPERKRISRNRKKQGKSEEPKFSMKTLKIKDTIVVVEADGTERPPNAGELAQHTRRGHWAHYGINGNGLFLGKYVKSMYRKPTTVGKFENGLVIKDYELEGTSEEA